MHQTTSVPYAQSAFKARCPCSRSSRTQGQDPRCDLAVNSARDGARRKLPLLAAWRRWALGDRSRQVHPPNRSSRCDRRDASVGRWVPPWAGVEELTRPAEFSCEARRRRMPNRGGYAPRRFRYGEGLSEHLDQLIIARETLNADRQFPVFEHLQQAVALRHRRSHWLCGAIGQWHRGRHAIRRTECLGWHKLHHCPPHHRSHRRHR
jgi:hypothetical protein